MTGIQMTDLGTCHSKIHRQGPPAAGFCVPKSQGFMHSTWLKAANQLELNCNLDSSTCTIGISITSAQKKMAGCTRTCRMLAAKSWGTAWRYFDIASTCVKAKTWNLLELQTNRRDRNRLLFFEGHVHIWHIHKVPFSLQSWSRRLRLAHKAHARPRERGVERGASRPNRGLMNRRTPSTNLPQREVLWLFVFFDSVYWYK